MSLHELFDAIKYDSAAHLHIQRLAPNHFLITVGETLSTSFECDSLEQGMRAAVELQRDIRAGEDKVEQRANAVKEWAKEHNIKIGCTITKRLACGQRKDRLICAVQLSCGNEPMKMIDPVCGWDDEHIIMTAISTLYFKTVP